MSEIGENIPGADGPVRLILADDQDAVRRSLGVLLATDRRIQVVAEASTGAEAVEKVRRLVPDVLLCDLRMPGGDGISVARQIRDLGLPTRVLLVTVCDDDHTVKEALRAGATGFLPKHAVLDELYPALVAAIAGERYLPPELRDRIDDESLAESSVHARLSAREFEVLRELASGASSREVAEKLQISIKTVGTHRANLLKKLSLRNNAELTRFAIQQGYVVY